MYSEEIISYCEQLTAEMSCDFVGIAIYDPYGKQSTWNYAVGNRNDKYKRITVRYGRGIAGNVIKTGAAMVIQSFPKDIKGKPTDYPIMLAEQLSAGIAVPLMKKNRVFGVLLAGHRQKAFYDDLSVEMVKRAASKIQRVISEDDRNFRTEVVL